MNAQLSVEGLRAAGFTVLANGDKLKVKGPGLTPSLVEILRTHKAELMAELRRDALTEDAAEYVSERTAICAADGLPSAMLRPVYKCTLRGKRPFIVLGRVGETLDQARTELRVQFGADFMALEHRRSGGTT